MEGHAQWHGSTLCIRSLKKMDGRYISRKFCDQSTTYGRLAARPKNMLIGPKKDGQHGGHHVA